ncbi:MAG: DNA polymerase III subunit delta [Candidatus Cloacimonadota bacterium]|nr:DNA polymerase III subunit delta [Candidatus Cloacimonadota bacterium]
MTKSKPDMLQYKFLPNIHKYKKESVFLIYGEDSFLKNQTLEKIQDMFVAKESRDFDYDIFFADEHSPEKVIDQLEQYPFFSKYKIVTYKGINNLTADKMETLAKYISDPNPTSKLFITADKIDKRKKANKQILNDCISISCSPPYSSKNLYGWLSKEMREQKVSMEPKARNLFVESVELDYQIAKNEFEKLILKANGKNISYSDVVETIGYSRTHNVFELQESIGKKNVHEVIKNLESLFENQESEVFIVIMLTNFFLQIWEIKVKMRENVSDFNIKKNFMKKIFYNKKDNYLTYAKNYKYKDLQKIFEYLLETDTKLKTISSVKKSILVELLVLNICMI